MSDDGQGDKRPGGPARHKSVMLPDVLEALAPQKGGVYVDGTFGAGGYTTAILEAADCTVVALDRDPEAINEAGPIVARYAPRLTLIQGRFGTLDTHLAEAGIGPADGVVFDLGVSSMQLDRPARGFSFRADGPLDMRMSAQGQSAADLVNTLDEADLAHIIWRFGDERRSRAIARAVVAARAVEPIMGTAKLADIVARALGGGHGRIHPATKTFQALRIAVNGELDELQRGLEAAERVLRPAGRLVVVSFHSLEDRMVKSFFTERSGVARPVSRHLPPTEDGPAPSFIVAKRRAVKPAVKELQENRRARSARLRVGVRTKAPAFAASPAEPKAPWQDYG